MRFSSPPELRAMHDECEPYLIRNEEGNKSKLEKWRKEVSTELAEREEKKLQESWGYIKDNWKGIRKRIAKEEGNHRKQYRRAYQPCSVVPNEFPSNGIEQGWSGQVVAMKGLLEKRRGHAGVSSDAENGKRGRKGGRGNVFQFK